MIDNQCSLSFLCYNFRYSIDLLMLPFDTDGSELSIPEDGVGQPV